MFWSAFSGLGLCLAALIAWAESERREMQRAARIDRARGGRPTRAEGAPGGLVRGGLGSVRQIVLRIGERLAVILGGEARETAGELASAGFRSRDALLVYVFLKTLLPLSAFLAGAGHVIATRAAGIEMLWPMATVIAGALALSKAVDLVVDQKRRARMARIRRGFPDMLELLVITSEAGLGPQPALHRVARVLHGTHPDLAREVLTMVSEMQMTNDRRAAYERLTARVPLPEVAVFTQTLDQSDTYGTPFSRAMRTLIEECRGTWLMQIEERAARLPVIMTIPLIFCIMPAVFVVLVGPAALSVLDNIIGAS